MKAIDYTELKEREIYLFYISTQNYKKLMVGKLNSIIVDSYPIQIGTIFSFGGFKRDFTYYGSCAPYPNGLSDKFECFELTSDEIMNIVLEEI